MKKIDIIIGDIIRNKRKVKGMTQLQLAHKLGYESMQFVSLFERGLSAVPHEVLGKICVILDIPESKFKTPILFNAKIMLTQKIKTGMLKARNTIKKEKAKPSINGYSKMIDKMERASVQ